MSDRERDRMPPQNVAAEAQMVGAMLVDNAAIDDVLKHAAPADCYRDSHAKVFRAVLSVRDSGRAADAITVAAELIASGAMDDEQEADNLLFDLIERTPYSANAEYHAGIVREHSVKRQLIAATAETLRECYDPLSGTAGEVAGRAEGRLFAVTEAEAASETPPLADLALGVMERIASRRGGECSGVSTGFGDLDDKIDGFSPRQMIVLAARPSLGKTALGLNIAEASAFGVGRPVLFVSLEMSAEELTERLIVGRSGVPGESVRAGALTDREMAKVGKAYDEVRACRRLVVDDRPLRTVQQIAALARREKRRSEIGLVVVDYLQLVSPSPDLPRGASRQEQVADISRRLKALAKEIKVPVLVLAQLNRESEKREDKRPRLSDLRESGAIEMDADVVVLLHRPEFYDPNARPGEADLIIAKNRNGPTGSVRLSFRKELARFENYAPPALGNGHANGHVEPVAYPADETPGAFPNQRKAF